MPTLFGGIRTLVANMLGLVPATSSAKTHIYESITFEDNVIKNAIWYRGDPVELEQFYKQHSIGRVVNSSVGANRFWAASSEGSRFIRKLHSGLPSMIVDKLADIVVNDMIDPKVAEEDLEAWESIIKINKFSKLLRSAVIQALSLGDGAFKICMDTILSPYPTVEFYAGNNVEYVYDKGILVEVQFKTDKWNNTKHYTLIEHYGKGYVKYNLIDDSSKILPVSVLPETAGLEDVDFPINPFILAESLLFYDSIKFENRGDSVYDKKCDIFDGIDEILSTWLDNVRAGRVKQYIPENLLPRNKEDGAILKPDVFNPYIVKGIDMTEKSVNNKIDTVQGSVEYDGLLKGYCQYLDTALQGLISPSTLGIDVKKLDNAESQREKEKTTLYTRGNLIRVLSNVLPELANKLLKAYAIMQDTTIVEHDLSFEWGEYANPSFEAVVETLGKAKEYKIMSTKKILQNMYSGTLRQEDIEQEYKDIREEYDGVHESNE